jgi:hypothetical protein
MSMQRQPAFKAAYIPPIECKCGGTAMLVRTVHQGTKSGTEELRMFQCYACHNITEIIVEN